MTATEEIPALNDAEYADLLAAIRELHRHRPNWRLGQMICAMAMLAGQSEAVNVYDLEDQELLAALRKQIRHDEDLEPIKKAMKRNSEPSAQVPV